VPGQTEERMLGEIKQLFTKHIDDFTG